MTSPFQRLSRRAILCLLCAALVPQCFGRKIKTLASAHANFNGYKTYRWVPVKTLGKAGIVQDDPAIAPIIRDSINRELTALGLTEVMDGGDLEVAAFASTASVPQLEAVIFPGGQALDFEMPVATMGRYNKEGTLAINLIDTQSNKSAWAGLATDSLDNKAGSGAKKIPGITAAIFKKYPTRKK
jgi:hypothetical protein